jgi:hypothetical protein
LIIRCICPVLKDAAVMEMCVVRSFESPF